ncbi:MAG: hypothetical protein HFJ06_13895 [Lachnospiraceae bacterium]|nr:hypothetical protein [Lachnospiraceae bacterium]
MHTKTMEGLVGASTNMKQLNTPMRVFKEARRKGDTAKMDRAMDYVSDFSGKVDEYQKKADEGMKEEAEELKKKEELEREKAIEKRREEKEKLEERIEGSRNIQADTVQVSEEGKILLKDAVTSDKQITGTEAVKPDMGKEPVIYTETGEVSQMGEGSNISISV